MWANVITIFKKLNNIDWNSICVYMVVLQITSFNREKYFVSYDLGVWAHDVFSQIFCLCDIVFTNAWEICEVYKHKSRDLANLQSRNRHLHCL